MFWGLIMEPERRYTQQVKRSFHISMASLDVGSSGSEPAQVMCGFDGRNYLLCTLKKPDLLQCPLDLEFAAGTEVSFASNGKSHIHLTGYLTDVDEDSLNLEDLEEQEDEEGFEEDETVEGEILKKNKKNKNIEKNGRPAKKLKLLNGSATEDVEADESDDPDFEEETESEDGETEDVEDSGEGDYGDDEDQEEGEDEEEQNVQQEQEVQQQPSKKEKKKKLKQKANEEASKTKKDQKHTLKSGVVIEDLVDGTGPPAKHGRFVNVYYEGRLEKDNKLFDSTNKGPGFKFRLGVGEVIKAWDIGVVGMKVGGVRKIICPPHTAYGPKGSLPAIPPNSTLVFTVTLKKVQ